MNTTQQHKFKSTIALVTYRIYRSKKEVESEFTNARNVFIEAFNNHLKFSLTADSISTEWQAECPSVTDRET
jgi:hypothetical protein